MLPLLLTLALLALAAGALLALRRRPAAPAERRAAPAAATGEGRDRVSGSVSLEELSARLFALAFATPSGERAPAPDAKFRATVMQALIATTPEASHLPRRPTLMPQLMRAMDDPVVAAERLSRIVAHDPVLAADVLKLANSGLYRAAGTAPVETIQRAIVVLGADALRGILASAMMQPVFRATRRNFPRFLRMLWERTERAARAAELYAMKRRPADRFEAQLAVLLHALGPLVVYGVLLDTYADEPEQVPDAALCMELVLTRSEPSSVAVARRWDASPRLLDALMGLPEEPLSEILRAGELMGTLSQLHAQQMMSVEEAEAIAQAADIPPEVIENLLVRVVA